MILIAVMALLLVPVKFVYDVFRPTSQDLLLRYANEHMALWEPGFRPDDYSVRARWMPSSALWGGHWEIHFEQKKSGKRRCFRFVENLLYGALVDIQCPLSSPDHPLP
jgi:hypothetical protein